MLKMSVFRTFEPFGFFWKKVTILKVTILALEISFVKLPTWTGDREISSINSKDSFLASR